MLLVGIDWAESEHAVCLMDEAGTILKRLRIAHGPVGVSRLHREIAAQQPLADQVVVGIERPDGLLVESLLTAGYHLYPFNPKSVDRYRERDRVRGGKSDPADAELLARVLLTDRQRHRELLPDSAACQALRSIAQDDVRAERDQRRLLNRLRQALLDVFPQALEAFTLGSTTSLRFLSRWPSAVAAQQATAAEIAVLLREVRHGQPGRAANQIRAALQADALAASATLAAAKASGIRLLAEQLLLLHRQRRDWEKQLRELLESDRPHPDGEVYLSLPGLDVRLTARVLGRLGDRRERFPTAASMQCYAATAPLTRASGKMRVVQRRFACNRPLRQALIQWAFCSLQRSAWAKEFYTSRRDSGQGHQQILRALANRWLEILHHLLATGQRYDETIHQRNRQHALGFAA